jgi:hypothetical protein
MPLMMIRAARTRIDKIDLVKLSWDVAWVAIPSLLLCYTYISMKHLEAGVDSGRVLRELVMFIGDVWAGLWMMAYPGLSYRVEIVQDGRKRLTKD